jgi:hypothetical protein
MRWLLPSLPTSGLDWEESPNFRVIQRMPESERIAPYDVAGLLWVPV